MNAIRGLAGRLTGSRRLFRRRAAGATRAKWHWPVFVLIATRNIVRNPRRTAITAGGAAFAILGYVALVTFFDGFYEQIIDTSTRYLTGHVQIERAGFSERLRSGARARPARRVARASADARRMSPGAAPRIQAQAIASSAAKSEGIALIGIDPTLERTVTFIHRTVVQGTALQPGRDHDIMIGRKLAEKLNVRLGEKIVITAQAAGGDLGTAAYRVSGIFATESASFDEGMAFVTLPAAQALLAFEGRVSTVNVRLEDRSQVPDAVAQLRPWVSASGYSVAPWQDLLPSVVEMIQFIVAIRIDHHGDHSRGRRDGDHEYGLHVGRRAHARARCDDGARDATSRGRTHGALRDRDNHGAGLRCRLHRQCVARWVLRPEGARSLWILSKLRRYSRGDRDHVPAARHREHRRPGRRALRGERPDLGVSGAQSGQARSRGRHSAQLTMRRPLRRAYWALLLMGSVRAAACADERVAAAVEAFGILPESLFAFSHDRSTGARHSHSISIDCGSSSRVNRSKGSASSLQDDNEVLAGELSGHVAIRPRRKIARRPPVSISITTMSRATTSSRGIGSIGQRYRGPGASTDVKVGRQRVALGTGQFWSPLDLLNPIDPTRLERDYRSGVDAVLVEQKLGALARVDGVYAPATGSVKSVAAGYLHGNARGTDYSVLVGSFRGDDAVGADFSTSRGGVGIRGEATLTRPTLGSRYARALLGADYGFRKHAEL